MKSHEVLKVVVESVGTKRVASDMKVSTSLVYKWCAEPPAEDPDASGARNPLDRLAELCRSTDDRRPIDWLCREFGGFFVERPEPVEERIDRECLNQTQGLLDRFSRLLSTISSSLEGDHRIDEHEAHEIREIWQQLLSHGETFVRGCESGAYDPKRPQPMKGDEA